MDITCVSDLHGYLPKLDGGDLLIVAGDLTARDEPEEHEIFLSWLTDLTELYDKIVYIAGNHDGYLKSKKPFYDLDGIHYLFDDGIEYEGFKIWGSPWTPTFCDWHFMKNRGKDIKEKWDLIPDDTNILITHGPPHGILDYCSPRRTKRLGCEDLYERVHELKSLRLHVFGHIHGGSGVRQTDHAIFVNAAIMNEDYEPVNKPIRIIL